MMDLSPKVSAELSHVEALIIESVECGISTFEDVFEHVFNAGGKRIRPAVLLTSCHAVGEDDISNAIPLAAALELIHTGTLIHDDINDNSSMRRGIPTAHVKFSVGDALMTADYLFVKGFSLVADYEKEIRDEIVQAITTMAEGEIIQAHNVRNVSLNEAEYLEINEKKTARPISAGAKAGSLIANGSPAESDALEQYGLNLGQGFQIMDDVLDVIGVEGRTGKFSGCDIREGKVTILSIHALSHSDPGASERLKQIITTLENTEEEVNEAIGLIKEAGSIDYALEICEKFGERAKTFAEELPVSEPLKKLADFTVTRDY
jgi:geranylgeranyl pyrophosphate synthase